jgi:transcriptional regulator with XRE-family HTH domain
MSKPKPPITASRVVGTRVRQLRDRKAWSQQELADRMTELGFKTHRETIARIEAIGKTKLRQRVSIDEVLLLAAALRVAPIHLFVPADDDQPVALTPSWKAKPAALRAWVRGNQPLEDSDQWRLSFYTEVPASELRGFLEDLDQQYRRDLQRSIEKAHKALVDHENRIRKLQHKGDQK